MTPSTPAKSSGNWQRGFLQSKQTPPSSAKKKPQNSAEEKPTTSPSAATQVSAAPRLFSATQTVTTSRLFAATRAGATPQLDERMFREDIVHFMEVLNKKNNVIYAHDFRRGHFYEPNLAEYKNKLERTIGFSLATNEYTDYIYRGNNPAEVLDRFFACEDYLFLDCTRARNLCFMMAHKKQIGDHNFNALIRRQRMGSLTLMGKYFSHSDIALEFRHRYICLNAPLPNSSSDAIHTIQKGDIVYMGIPCGFAFHLQTEFNAYHLICVGNNEANEPLFLGFSSTEQVPYTLDEIGKNLENNYKKNLTYFDLAALFIHKDQTHQASLSNLSYSAAWKLLLPGDGSVPFEYIQQFACELNIALIAYQRKDFQKLYSTSSIPIPDSHINTPYQMFSITYLNFQSEGAFHCEFTSPALDSVLVQPFLQEGYQIQHPSQQSFLNALSYFYSRATTSDTGFFALYIFGDSGVGKTDRCHNVINKLREEGKNVWATSSTSTALQRSYMRKLTRNEVPMDPVEIKNGFSSEWENADIIYIDGIQSDTSRIAKAALSYAKENGKMLLLNSQDNPIDGMLLEITNYISDLAIVQIKTDEENP